MRGKLSVWIRSAPLLLLGLLGLLLAIPQALLRPASAESAAQEAPAGNGEERPAHRQPPGVTVWLWHDSGSLVLQSTKATSEGNWVLSGTITTSGGAFPIVIAAMVAEGGATPVSWDEASGLFEGDDGTFGVLIPGDEGHESVFAFRMEAGKNVVLAIDALSIPTQELVTLAATILDSDFDLCWEWAIDVCGAGNVRRVDITGGCYFVCRKAVRGYDADDVR